MFIAKIFYYSAGDILICENEKCLCILAPLLKTN